jgi:hypothetical protein
MLFIPELSRHVGCVCRAANYEDRRGHQYRAGQKFKWDLGPIDWIALLHSQLAPYLQEKRSE